MPLRITSTPRRTATRARRCAAVLWAVAIAIMAGWVAGFLPDTRLVLACYLTALLFAVVTTAVVVLARCHLAIAAAFAAGFQTGQHAARVDPDQQTRLHRAPAMRLVN